MSFRVELEDKDYEGLCTEAMPCETLLKEMILTVLRDMPVKVEMAAAFKMTAPLESPKCPDCGSKMVSRKSQHGTFWGCSTYPQCKGTRDTMGRSRAEREQEKSGTTEEKAPSKWNVR